MNSAQYEDAVAASKVLNAIGHPIRLLIVCCLTAKEHCVSDIVEELGTTAGNISQHLRQLENIGLLSKRRDGNRTYYSVRDGRISKLVCSLRDLYCTNLTIHKPKTVKERKSK